MRVAYEMQLFALTKIWLNPYQLRITQSQIKKNMKRTALSFFFLFSDMMNKHLRAYAPVLSSNKVIGPPDTENMPAMALMVVKLSDDQIKSGTPTRP